MKFKEYVYDKFIFKVKDGIYYHKDGCWVEKLNGKAKIEKTNNAIKSARKYSLIAESIKPNIKIEPEIKII